MCKVIGGVSLPSRLFYKGFYDVYKYILTGFSFEASKSGLLAPDPESTKTRFLDFDSGFNFFYDPNTRNDMGYILVSKADPKNNSLPSIELWDLNKQILIQKYNLDKNEITGVSKSDLNKLRIIHPLLLNDGSLIANTSRGGVLLKFDKCGRLLKQRGDLGFHHSVHSDSLGRIYVPITNVPNESKPHKLDAYKNEGFAILNKELEIIKIISLTDIFKKAGIESEIYSEDELSIDPFHLNDVKPLTVNEDTTLVFLSLRHQGMIIGFHLENNKPLWVIKGSTLLQHDVDPINEEGTAITVFDNNTSRFNEKLPNFSSHNGNKLISVYNLPSNVNDQNSKPKFYLGKLLESQGLTIEEESFEYLPIDLKPITKTQGLGGLINNKQNIFIEETNYRRLFEIDKNNKEILWQYINKANKNSYSYLMSWSRRVDNINSMLNQKYFNSCK